MGQLDQVCKKAILKLSSRGWTAGRISDELREHYHVEISRQAISRFIARYKVCRSLTRKAGSGRKSKITPEVLRIVEAKMQADDETTPTQLLDTLNRSGVNISLKTVKRCRQKLGWTFHGSRYCQMIRDSNKVKRLEWCVEQQHAQDSFNDVIWSDETSVQLERHRRHSFRKKGQPPKLKPRPKHPVKVHVWAGISKRGATQGCIFEGKMDAEFYTRILQCFLLPFVQSQFPLTHGCMQDNDPKHTSKKAKLFNQANGINW